MKKLKNFYNENRIYCILMLISFGCFLIMGLAVLGYFIHQTTTSSYGKRLENIEKYELKNELKDLENYFKEDKNVTKATARLQGKIIYITVDIANTVSNEDIENLATGSLAKLSDEQKQYYDLQFIFKRDNMIPYFGSKSSNNASISWTLYNIEVEDNNKDKDSEE